MSDGYWRYTDSRHPQPPPQLSASSAPSAPASLIGKRPRPDYSYDPIADIPRGRDLSSYYSRDDDRGTIHGNRDTGSINASYDRYLRSMQLSSAGQSTRPSTAGLASHPVDDLRSVGVPDIDLGATGKDQSMGLAAARPKMPLPPDASSTLFVEGLPPDCTRREVAHIFRPFLGYKEVRLVSKDSRHSRGHPMVLCFVDFASPAHAATAMDALQGYHFDELDRSSAKLKLQFARYPGGRSSGGPRGKR